MTHATTAPPAAAATAAQLPGQVATHPDVPGVILLAQGFTFWALTPDGRTVDEYPHAAAAGRLVPLPARHRDPDPHYRPGRADLEAAAPFAQFAAAWFGR